MIKKFTKKSEIENFLIENPTWVLQHCSGTRGHAWWWLRETATAPNTINCNANAAYPVSKTMRSVSSESDWNTHTYRSATK